MSTPDRRNILSVLRNERPALPPENHLAMPDAAREIRAREK